jgi:adenylate cyclase, class 2
MQEIEQKFAHADFAAIEQRLHAWGAEKGAEHDEADHYFNAPDRDFAQTDEAFRLRRVGPANCLTYKGPKRPGGVKKRTELEISINQGPEAAEQFMQLLAYLGYRPVAVVRKRRRHYHCKQNDFALTICLDEVEGLGRFAEVEVLAEPDHEQTAEAQILATASALGLTEVERRSYLEMVLSSRTGGRA